MADVLMAVHSTGLGPFMWRPFAPAAQACGLQWLTPPNRGYAAHDLLPRGQPFDVADEIAHLRAHIPADVTGVHLAGHSYGALAALRLARRLLDEAARGGPVLRSLWLVEPVLFGALRAMAQQLDDEAAADVRTLFEDPSHIGDDAFGGRDAWLQRFVDYWNAPGAWEAQGERARQAQRAVGWKMFQEVRAVALQCGEFADHALPVPITLVQGAASPAAARAMVRALAAVNPQACIDVLAGQGHMGLVAQPEPAVESLARHLSAHTVVPAA